MPGSDEQFERQLAAIFQAEAAEHVQRMQSSLAQLEGDGTAAKPVELLFRAAHSLKGAARAVGQDEIELVCHATESLLAGLQRGRMPWSPALADTLHQVVQVLERALAGEAGAARALVGLIPRLQRLERAEQGAATRVAPSGPASAGLPIRSAGPTAPTAASLASRPTPAHDVPLVPRGTPAEAAPAAQAVAAATPAISTPSPAAPGPVVATAQAPEQTVRVAVDRLSRLLYQAEELVAAKLQAADHVRQISEAVGELGSLRASWGAAGSLAALQRHENRLRALQGAARREQRQLAGAVDALLADVKQVLLLPVGSLRPLLTATVRELARSQQREIELRIHGDEVEMDRGLLQELREPLLHLVRNAIAHGIEPPDVRLAAGKPAQAVLEVRIVSRSGGRVEVTVADDGAGIDPDRLAAAARELQLPVASDADEADLLPLIFSHGVSTAPRLTAVAGRGVGLAIVRETVERLGGTVSVRSRRGQGTTFTIALMQSLATYRAVEVHAAGRGFLLPTLRVERCMRFAPSELRTVGGRQSLAVGDEELPLASLAALLGLPAAAEPPAKIHGLVVEAAGKRIALAVDEIRGEHEVLGKPVDPAVTKSAVLAGAAVLGTGRAAAILNVPELMRLALRDGAASPGAAVIVPARRRGRSVLLAEDSITSRTLLKNILELDGHRVQVAVDGSEALAKLRAGQFDLVVSDIEMPNLDGIGLTQAIRSDPALARLPVVLVTSLASPADRERGAEAGANAYIVKSSFDQGNLLQAIAELA